VIKSRKDEAHFSGRWLSDAYSPHPGRLLGIPGCLWESPGYLLDAQEEKREGGGSIIIVIDPPRSLPLSGRLLGVSGSPPPRLRVV